MPLHIFTIAKMFYEEKLNQRHALDPVLCVYVLAGKRSVPGRYSHDEQPPVDLLVHAPHPRCKVATLNTGREVQLMSFLILVLRELFGISCIFCSLAG